MVFVKGTDFLLEGGENALRLAYSGVTPDQIDEGVTRLAAAYREPGGRRGVTDGPRLELLRPRDIGGLFRDSFNTYSAHFATFLALGAAVVIPVELVVSGIGLGQLSGGYRPA